MVKLRRIGALSFGMGVVLLGSAAFASPVQVASAPENDLALTLSAISSAQKTLRLNIYEFTSAVIAQAVIDRINAGVHVEILQEGEPVTPITAQGKAVISQILQAMKKVPQAGDHYFIMGGRAQGVRRYTVDHAKYAVIDNARAVIGSENYSPTGHPHPGTIGNRGWEVMVGDPQIVAGLNQLFEVDVAPTNKDIRDLMSVGTASGLVRATQSTSGSPRVGQPTSPVFNATQLALVASPNNSLQSLLALIAHAQRNLDIEQLSFYQDWAKVAPTSPLYSAVLAAADRGVHVRVLLNDGRAFNGGHGGGTGTASPDKNALTIAALNAYAASKHLQLEARTANLSAMGVDIIHNKGVLEDSDVTLVSSINWDENAVEHNRETGLLIRSPQVHAYYQALFDKDWNASATPEQDNLSRPAQDLAHPPRRLGEPR